MTLCLNPLPSIPRGLLSDPYFQREVFPICPEDAAVIATAAEFIQQLADALKNFGMAMLGAFKEAMDAVADAVEKVVNVINAIIDWVIEQIKQAVNAVLNPIIDALNNWASGVLDAFNDGFGMLFDGDPNDNDQFDIISASVGIFNALFAGGFLFNAAAILTVLEWVSIFMIPFTTMVGIGVVVGIVAPLLIMGIIGMMGNGEGPGSLITALAGGDLGTIGETLETLLLGTNEFNSGSSKNGNTILQEQDWPAEWGAFSLGVVSLLPVLYNLIIVRGSRATMKAFGLLICAAGAFISYWIDSDTEGTPGDISSEYLGLVLTLIGTLLFGSGLVFGGLPKPGTTASLMFQIELFVMLGSWATTFLIIAF